MSQENVDALHQAIEAYNEARPRMAWVEGVYRGHEGIRSWWGAYGSEAQALEAAGAGE
jgi:hypothetical protein